MPELPEVEVLVRHLTPVLNGERIRTVEVRRPRVIRPNTAAAFEQALVGARFTGVTRRAKYLVFTLDASGGRAPFTLLGHLGMTGRMYVARRSAALPVHAAVILGLGARRFVFEDARYFGRLTLDTSALGRLGPEPLERGFTPAAFHSGLRRSSQAIKVRLLDQGLVAGVGNIYASEALFRARLSPQLAANRLNREQAVRLHRAIRRVLREAIHFGSTVPLDWEGRGDGDSLFYYGRASGATGDHYHERLAVYDRAGLPCRRCGQAIRCIVQAGRSTYYCPECQPKSPSNARGDAQRRHRGVTLNRGGWPAKAARRQVRETGGWEPRG